MATTRKTTTAKPETITLTPGNSGQRVTQKQLAALVGLSPRQLRDDAWKTCPVVERKGTSTIYNTARVYEWARNSATVTVPVLDDEDSKEDAKRLLRSKADGMEYEADRKLFMLAKLRRDMVPRDVAEQLVNGLFTVVRRTILERTNRHAERLVGIETVALARERIDKMNGELLLAISETPFALHAVEAAMAQAEAEEGDEPEEPDAEDDTDAHE